MSEEKNNKFRHFAITVNNPEKTPSEMISDFEKLGVYKCVFQLERGEKEGTPHYQGMISFKNPRYPKAISKALECWCKELPDLKDRIKYQQYCKKERTKELGPWGFGYKEFEITEDYSNIPTIEKLYDWQEKLKDILVDENVDDRKIHWYYDVNGNVGKTEFAKYMCIKHNALYVNGKAADIKCVFGLLKKEKKPMPKIVIFDFVRSTEGYISYDAIESVKNGIFFNGKYESGMIIMKKPHVVCFANYPPDVKKLSSDRWNIVDLSQ